jgi:hypothetical protein
MVETILQHWVITNFALPFLLIFFLLYGILEKTGVLGKDQHRLNALTAFVVGLIFVGAVFPKLVVGNLILFLTVSIVVVFIALLLWGFLIGGEAKIPDKLKLPAGILVIVAVVVAVFWALGLEGNVFDLLFRQSWSTAFWTNAAFIAVIIIALAAIIMGGKK